MQEIEKSELTQEYMKELYEQKVILRVGLSDVWYSYPSSQCLAFLSGYELIHHRVTQSFTEFNQFEIKRIELRETLCYSVVKTHYYTIMHPLILLLSAAE